MRPLDSLISTTLALLLLAALHASCLVAFSSSAEAQIDFDAPRAVRVTTGTGREGAVAFGDLNGDGRNDYLALDFATSVDLTAHLDDGRDQYFATASVTAPSPARVNLIRDFDGDGNNDALIGSTTLRFYQGDGEGSLTPFLSDLVPGFSARAAHDVDIGGDGNDDLFLLHDGGGRSYFGDGSGGFSPSPDSSFSAASVEFADFNEDGLVDLLTQRPVVGGLSLALGDGSGVFVPQPVATGAEVTIGVAIGDFNGDSHADLAITDRSLDQIRFFDGDGTGSFSPSGTVATVAGPTAIVGADFDADGDLEIAVAGSGHCEILLGAGTGAFSRQTSFEMYDPITIHKAPLPSSLEDLFFVSWIDDLFLRVRLEPGAGALAGVSSPLTAFTRAIGKGDFNEDGILDILVTGSTTTERHLATYFGDATGAFFGPVVTNLNFAAGFEVGDFNEDGHLDVALIHRLSIPNWQLLILTGNGTGTFSQHTTIALNEVVNLQKGDLDADGHLDLVAIVDENGTSDKYVAVLWGSGNATFTVQRLPFFERAVDVAIGSFNSSIDSHIDLMVSDSFLGGTALVEGNGNRGFALGPAFPKTDLIAPGDFNGDGHLDIVTQGWPETEVRLNSGFGTFPDGFTIGSQIIGTMRTRDFNHDGNVDLLVTGRDSTGSFRTAIYLGNGRGELAPAIDFGIKGSITTGDFDMDGLLDLVTSESTSATFASNRSFALEHCRHGVVNVLDGVRVDALTVNNSVGDAERSLTVDGSSPIEVSVDRAPSPAAGGKYYAAIWAGAPSPATASDIRTGAGFACFQPIRVESDYVMPLHVANTLRPNDPRLDPPSANATGNPAPGVALAIPAGSFPPGTVLTAQAIIGDSATLSRKNVSVTNAVVLTVE